MLVRSAPGSLDPSELEKAGNAGRNLSRLLYETLVILDDRGIPQPGLATSWQSDTGNQRWQFSLRRGVTFSDGSPLTAESVAAALRVANSSWRVSADVETVAVQLDSPNIDFPAELALVHNSIVRRDSGKLSGTGPFTVTQWQAGKKLGVVARDDHWSGRPFLDSVEIDLNNDPRGQAVDLSKYQLADMASEQARRAAGSGHSTDSSAPSDLLALVFARGPASTEEGQLRDALSLAIDRKVLSDVLLQGGGETAPGLLPGWMTGYAFLFSAETDLPLARRVVSEVKLEAAWSLGYDANDPLARLMAERIALNANDAGIKLVASTKSVTDVRLMRLSLTSLDPDVALASLAANAGLTPPKFTSHSSEERYAAERVLLQTKRVIPLVHLKSAVALTDSIKNWSMSHSGDWHLSDVWLGADKP